MSRCFNVYHVPLSSEMDKILNLTNTDKANCCSPNDPTGFFFHSQIVPCHLKYRKVIVAFIDISHAWVTNRQTPQKTFGNSCSNREETALPWCTENWLAQETWNGASALNYFNSVSCKRENKWWTSKNNEEKTLHLHGW